jgi:DNA repair protein RadC
MNVKLRTTQKIKVISSQDIYKIMQQILLRENKIDRNKEHLWTVGLDHAQRILYVELISLGTSTSAPVEPMQVYRIAVQKAAASLIVVHNHPSGEVQPSDEDIVITDRLLQVGKILGIELTDHLVISENSYNSFADTGLLNTISLSTKFVPSYKKVILIKKEAEQIGKEKGEKSKAITIAIELKDRGMDTSTIAIVTGLSIAEIEKLKSTKQKIVKK